MTMKFALVNLIIGIIISRGHGFLTIMDPSTSQSGTSSASKLQNGSLDVYDFLAEEKALRRQLERIVLDMKQEMVELKANNTTGLKEDIGIFNQTVQQIQQENNELKKTIQMMQHTTVELKQELGNLTQENIGLKERINVMNSSVETLKPSVIYQQHAIENQSNTVVFSARSTNGGTVNVGQVVHFNSVVTNVGGGYNETDSKFYCSLSGLYLFQATLVSPTSYGEIRIVQNGYAKLRIYSGQHSGYDSGSGTIFLRLLVGDQVWAMAFNTLNVDQASSFNGALIAP